MSFFDTKWTVEFEYSNGLLSSYKKATMQVEASSEYDAKSKAKPLLRANYSYFNILCAYESKGGKPTTNLSQKKIYNESSVVNKPKRSLSEWEINYNHYNTELYLIKKQEKKIIRIRHSHTKTIFIGCIITIVAVLISLLPYIRCDSLVKYYQELLDISLEHGDSMESIFVQSFLSSIEKYEGYKKIFILFPIVPIIVGIGLTTLSFFKTKKKIPSKVEKEVNELKIMRNLAEEYRSKC